MDEFEIDHTKAGFELFFNKIRYHEVQHKLPVSIAMEGYSGYARPLDQMIRTRDVSQLWYLNFLSSAKSNLTELSRKRLDSILKIKGIGKTLVKRIQAWQQQTCFSPEVELVSPLILQDVHRIIELNQIIKALDRQIRPITIESKEATLLESIPGFGATCCAEIAGEIGTIKRFAAETSLALCLGMATLDKSSGTFQGSKVPKHVNTRAKATTMVAVDHHRRNVAETKRYYEKKRAEGKKHNQAIRALGRHLGRGNIQNAAGWENI